jgi:hypothetical protein
MKDDDRSHCEECDGFTERSCKRCGQRICRHCAGDHRIGDYGNYLGDISSRCTPQLHKERTRIAR